MWFFDFMKIVLSQEQLILYFQEKGVLKSTSVCHECEMKMKLQKYAYHIDGYVFRCLKCKRRTTLRSGTFLEQSKLSLPVFAMMLLFHHLGVLQKDIAEMLDLNSNTVVDYSNFIREQCSNVLIRDDEKLGGQELEWRIEINAC